MPTELLERAAEGASAPDGQNADVVTDRAADAGRSARGASLSALATVGAASAGVLVVAAWGRAVVARDPRIHVNAPPFVGEWLWTDPTVRFLGPVLVALAVVLAGPRMARSLRWPALLVATGLASAIWTVALAVTDGWSRLWEPLTTQYEYLGAVSKIANLPSFLRSFTRQLPSYPTHVRGHPPGFVVVLWALDRIGLDGPRWAAALIVVTAASAGAAVLLAVADVGDRSTARLLAPFLILVPAAVWTATSGDAFFAGVGAWAVVFGVLATSPRSSRRRSTIFAVASGVLFAAVALLSYGLVLLGFIPLAVALSRRRLAPLTVIGGVAGGLLVALWAASGFWWLDGLAATRAEQLAGVAPRRPYGYFAFANMAVLVVAVGPAAVAGWTRLRRHPAAVLVAGSAAAVLLATASGFSKGEVERIWLPFFPWLMAGAAGVAGLRLPRLWLASSAALAILIQLCLRTPW